jgi:hypothetical protein
MELERDREKEKRKVPMRGRTKRPAQQHSKMMRKRNTGGKIRKRREENGNHNAKPPSKS